MCFSRVYFVFQMFSASFVELNPKHFETKQVIYVQFLFLCKMTLRLFWRQDAPFFSAPFTIPHCRRHALPITKRLRTEGVHNQARVRQKNMASSVAQNPCCTGDAVNSKWPARTTDNATSWYVKYISWAGERGREGRGESSDEASLRHSTPPPARPFPCPSPTSAAYLPPFLPTQNFRRIFSSHSTILVAFAAVDLHRHYDPVSAFAHDDRTAASGRTWRQKIKIKKTDEINEQNKRRPRWNTGLGVPYPRAVLYFERVRKAKQPVNKRNHIKYSWYDRKKQVPCSWFKIY